MSGIDVKVISVLLPSYQIIRLGAYWNQIEPEPGTFHTDDLDWQIEAAGQRLLVTEGQAEPWETVTTPPDPKTQGMYSCLPEHLITNYNAWLSTPGGGSRLFAYLFWGAEYWLLRKQGRIRVISRPLLAFRNPYSRRFDLHLG